MCKKLVRICQLPADTTHDAPERVLAGHRNRLGAPVRVLILDASNGRIVFTLRN
jgi:hypothetical protein